jgi:hypothetical protein
MSSDRGDLRLCPYGFAQQRKAKQQLPFTKMKKNVTGVLIIVEN